MYTNKRTPRTTPRRRVAFTTPRPSPGRAVAVNARRRLNFTSQPTALMRVGGRRLTASRVGFLFKSYIESRRVTVNTWDNTAALMSAKDLIVDELTVIPRKTGVATISIQNRECDVIDCKGFNLRFAINNGATTNAVCMRLAVISPIDKNALSVVDFFRGYDGNRGKAFTSNTDASELLWNPINRDNHVVLWEKKIMLGPGFDSSVSSTNLYFSRTSDSFTTFQTYVKLNRQLRYSGEDADTCTDKVFLVAWYDYPNGNASATPPAATLSYKRFGVTHWKDP